MLILVTEANGHRRNEAGSQFRVGDEYSEVGLDYWEQGIDYWEDELDDCGNGRDKKFELGMASREDCLHGTAAAIVA